MPQPRKYLVTDAMIESRSWNRRQKPVFRVKEVAKFFFGMSESWIRLKVNPDAEHPQTWFVKDGRRMEFRRADPSKTDSARIFWLSDIEPMAYSLYDFGAIDGARLRRVLDVVQAVAAVYSLFDDPGLPAEDDPGADEDGD